MKIAGHYEFTCADCGRAIVALIFDPAAPPYLCGACLTVPGWFRYPDTRRIIAGGEPLNLPEHERDAG